MLKKPSKKLSNLKNQVKNGCSQYISGFAIKVITITGIMLVVLSLPSLSSQGYDRWVAYKNSLRDDNRLVAYYTFEAGSGSVLANMANNDPSHLKDGTISGATWSTGGGRWAEKNTLSFDGIDDFVNCTSNSDFDFGANDFTIEAWIKTSSTTMAIIFSKGSATGFGYFFNISSGGLLQFHAQTSVGWNSLLGNTICNNGVWHYVGVTKRGTSVKFYLDGALDGERTLNGVSIINSSGYAAMIGAVSSFWFQGPIDELAVYNSALTGQEIENHYVQGNNGVVTGSYYYYSDYRETDQGAAGTGPSVKDLLDSVGFNSATIVLAHNSGSATTTYTFSTDLTLPANIKLLVEKGAIISVALGKTLTINGPLEASLHKVFSGSGSVTFGPSVAREFYPQWWGAKGDGTTDDTTAIQSMFNTFVGGTTSISAPLNTLFFFPPGLYKVTSPLYVRCRGAHIVGSGNQWYPNQLASPYNKVNSTILVAHTGNGLVIDAAASVYTTYIDDLTMEDISFIADSGITSLGAAIEFLVSPDPAKVKRSFYFNRVTARLFKYGIHQNDTSQPLIDVHIDKCTIQNNQYGIWNMWSNGFYIKDNEIRDNSLGGIYGKMIEGCIINNVLEGQPEPIRLDSAGAFTIEDNYFESNTGGAGYNIYLNGCNTFRIGQNQYDVVTGQHDTIFLDKCSNAEVVGQPRMSWCYNIDVKPITNSKIMSYKTGVLDWWVAVSRPKASIFELNQVDTCVSDPVGTGGGSGKSPVGIGQQQNIPVLKVLSNGTEVYNKTLTISGSSGQWVVCTIATKQTSGIAHTDIAVRLTNGTQDYTGGAIKIYLDDSFRVKDWIFCTTTLKLTAAITSIQVRVGYTATTPANNYDLLPPFVYIANSMQDIQMAYNLAEAIKLSAAPTTGTWNVGDTIWKSNPGSGGTPGFICVTAGTPGTWRAMANLKTTSN